MADNNNDGASGAVMVILMVIIVAAVVYFLVNGNMRTNGDVDTPTQINVDLNPGNGADLDVDTPPAQ